MRQIIAAGIFVLLVAFHAQGAASITGEYKTKQTNLSGTLLVKQLPDKLVQFEINTVKRGSGDYAKSVTTCSASGVALMNEDGAAVYSYKEDYMENPFKIILHLKKNQIAVESNADEAGQCGMGAWIDGEYMMTNSNDPKFIE